MKKASRLFATGTDFGGVMSGPWFEKLLQQFLSLVPVGDHAAAYVSFEVFWADSHGLSPTLTGRRGPGCRPACISRSRLSSLRRPPFRSQGVGPPPRNRRSRTEGTAYRYSSVNIAMNEGEGRARRLRVR